MTPDAVNAFIVIPAYNEAGSLPSVLDELRTHRCGFPVLVVDDASSDATLDVVRGSGANWLRLSSRIGTGGAVRAGIRHAMNHGANIVVRVDGDGQHRADDIEAMLQPILRNEADAVRGSRFIAGTGHAPTGLRRFGQWILGAFLSAIMGEPVSDPTSGCWAFGPRALELLAEHHPTGYPEPELALLLWRNRLRTVEVPVHMRCRIAGETSLTASRTGLAIARVLLALVIVPVRPYLLK